MCSGTHVTDEQDGIFKMLIGAFFCQGWAAAARDSELTIHPCPYS
jgi:hypothetical protein